MKISKPWGYEEILFTNERYTLKKLFLKKGHRCSLQFHELKHETVYVISGTLNLTIKDDIKANEYVLSQNQHYSIPPNIIHRMEGLTDCTYLEASTSELDDVVRLVDDYGRTN